MNKDKRYYMARVGNLNQIAYAKKAILTEGKADGLRVINIDNGGILACTLLEGRNLDIAKLSYKGINLGFLSKPGLVTSSQTSASPGEFTRYFQGGMLYTCGLLNVGPNDSDERGLMPLHGRLGTTPAEEVNTKIDWDKGFVQVNSITRIAALFNHNLVLKRSIKIPLFGKKIEIVDIVENQGFIDEDIMLLYHINFGWPMLSEYTTLKVTHDNVEPRDEEAKKGLNIWNTFETPRDVYPEQVFYHSPIKSKDDMAHATLWNEKLALGVDVSFDPRTLPQLIQWKSMAAGDYALGIEPSTNKVEGIKKEKEEGRILTLKPGEEKTFKIILKIIEKEN